MRLAENRFYRTVALVRVGGEVHEVTRHSYDSHAALYDVDVYADGTAGFRMNSKPVNAANKFHAAISRHFDL